jgi:dTDP-4-amino-4,6-dideoxygalactose transaminase
LLNVNICNLKCKKLSLNILDIICVKIYNVLECCGRRKTSAAISLDKEVILIMIKIPFSPPDIGQSEIDEVVDTLKSGWITTGPKTKLFEKQLSEFCGTSRTVCLNSATAAMELTLRILGIGPGDEVITSAYTYTASASVADHVGAKLVLVDTSRDSYEMDYDKLADAVNERTKAIIAVDLAGIMCDYERIFDAVESKKDIFSPSNDIQSAIGRVAVLSDGAHALGARRRGKNCGQVADFTTFSFHAVKNLTTGEGGAVTWCDIDGVDSDELYRQYQLLSLHGQSKDALAKSKPGLWEYDIVAPYYKCNMTDIMASLGIAQLRRYNDIINRRHEIIERYNQAFLPYGVKVMPHVTADSRSNGHLYMMRLPGCGVSERNNFITELANQGIAANVHYKPLPMMTAYKSLGFDISDYPNAYSMFENEVTLPLHTCLSDSDVDYIIGVTCGLLEKFCR